MSAYQQALTTAPEPVGANRSKAGSVAATIASHYGSPEFRALAASSQAVRRAVLERFGREHGDKMIAAMPTKFLREMLDRMEPTTAKNWLAAIRALTGHAIKRELIENDPTLGIKLRRMTGDGFHTWTEEQIAQFEAVHPIGSRERLAMALGLFTGQRRGDVVRMGGSIFATGSSRHAGEDRQGAGDPDSSRAAGRPRHRADDADDLRADATRQAVRSPRLHPVVRPSLRRGGLPSACTFHGLRKAACRRLAEAGCTVHEIAAISGHATLKEVERYTKAADQQRLAQTAMARSMAAAKGVA